MRAFFLICFAVSVVSLSVYAKDCTNADPSSLLRGVTGDFEIKPDPQDDSGNLLYVNHTADGAADVVVARLDGTTGRIMAGSVTKIANNFYGESVRNGPEFVQVPSGEFGIVYAGVEGVHAAFRPAKPKKWNQFEFDVTGKRTLGTPPSLSSSNGLYPVSGSPRDQYTYGEKGGGCRGRCFGILNSGTTTPVDTLLEDKGFVSPLTIQSPRDTIVYASICHHDRSCGLYEVQIDGLGGVKPGTFRKIANLQKAPFEMATARHPVTGSIIIFSNNGTTAVDIWEQNAAGGPLQLIGAVPVLAVDHFRAETDAERVVLHYLVRSGRNEGSYTVSVTEKAGELVVGSSSKITDRGSGVELVWSPKPNKWGAFFASSKGLSVCWVAP